MNKHRTLKAAFAAVLAALMAFAVFPVSALPAFEAEKSPVAPYWTVPEGYNAHDYNKCVEFLEQEDENGVKNGQKLNPDYDPNDPETWVVGSFDAMDGTDDWFDEFCDGETFFPIDWMIDSENVQVGFGWYEGGGSDGGNGIKHVRSIVIPPLCRIYENYGGEHPYLNDESNYDFAGNMDFSGMEWLNHFIIEDVYSGFSEPNSIDLSNCDELTVICCISCQITELNISGDQNIHWFDCCMSHIENELDISNIGGEERWVEYLGITGMGLRSFDFPEISIDYLKCSWNMFETLDLSNIPSLTYFYYYMGYPYYYMGYPDEDYTGLQELKYLGRTCRVEGNGYIWLAVYSDEEDSYWRSDEIEVEGSDGEPFEGWYDESGNLICEDARLYFDEGATGVFIAKFVSDDEPIPGDVDGDGEISAADALMLLRFCVGESQSIDLSSADANGDGVIDLMDALIVLRMAIGAA